MEELPNTTSPTPTAETRKSHSDLPGLVNTTEHPLSAYHGPMPNNRSGTTVKDIADQITLERIQEFRNFSLQWATTPTEKTEVPPISAITRDLPMINSLPSGPVALYVLQASAGGGTMTIAAHRSLIGTDRPDLFMVQLTIKSTHRGLKGAPATNN
uniref:Uncharacterized protein n=1 Tax=Caenorhabditis japonica TaxID=281687 RepID=A0A8R1ETB8_CAEJA